MLIEIENTRLFDSHLRQALDSFEEEHKEGFAVSRTQLSCGRKELLRQTALLGH